MAGTHGWVESPAVKKKIDGGGRGIANNGRGRRFRPARFPVKLFQLTCGPQRGVCEVGMCTKFGEECFNCHGSL